MKVKIMAIGNVTPDSFYAASRIGSHQELLRWAHQSIADGADILDIGACSTRPGSTAPTIQEEWERLEPALRYIRQEIPSAPLSIDTYRPEIADRALEQFGPMMINDVSGGCDAMYAIVRKYQVPYIWTLRGNLQLPEQKPDMNDMDLILDPGFGFIGSPEGDYQCMRAMDTLRAYNRPVLVGVSRKSMIWKPLGLTPETSLCATQVLQFYALEHGATILRTHDVRETYNTIELYNKLVY